ncbi:RluA family pseudouridine synthase [Desulfogranum japonicum]|uniref:RluA family pseudouridine synthase n=1 Tax=Desulfogranum japonicum TaxID=231447 RepID=UPI0013778983|nr:RluA family pseudouridine synthase [Desulfogranum japonicum]
MTQKKKPTSYTVKTEDTLLANLLTNLPQKKRKLIKAVLRDRQVSVDGEIITQFDHSLTPGQRIEILWDKIVQEKHPRELNIVYMDDDLIVINKPSGLLTVATNKKETKTAYAMLHKYLRAENPENKLFVIHRLDRETSGLLVFARSESVRNALQETWNSTIGQRDYVGVVQGEVEPAQGTLSSWLNESKAFTVYSSQKQNGGKKAVTHYTTIQGNSEFSLLQLNVETNLKHQVRVHMQDIQHPILGDKKYGSTADPIGRMCLHAKVLVFTHPTTGKTCRFDTGVPTPFLKFFTIENGNLHCPKSAGK